MTNTKKTVEEILKELQKDQSKIDRIINKTAIIDTHRKQKELYLVPPDMDFCIKEGHTEYEVSGHFCSHIEDYILNKIIHKLNTKEME